jgi:hypothetical protein
MTREVMQQALEALHYSKFNKAVTILREALEQPVQEPTPWRDMVVVSLVREGINKHKARELADHFVNFTLAPPPPVQEPWGACVSGRVFVGALPEHVRKLTEDDGLPIQLLYTTPPAVERPWAGLTEDEKFEMAAMQYGWEDLLIAAEAKLKEKNT